MLALAPTCYFKRHGCPKSRNLMTRLQLKHIWKFFHQNRFLMNLILYILSLYYLETRDWPLGKFIGNSFLKTFPSLLGIPVIAIQVISSVSRNESPTLKIKYLFIRKGIQIKLGWIRYFDRLLYLCKVLNCWDKYNKIKIFDMMILINIGNPTRKTGCTLLINYLK